MMDAVERCLDLLDKDGMQAFVLRFQKTLRKALGLPSKVSLIQSWLVGSHY